MKGATTLGGTQSCLTTTLEWIFGIGKDPFVTIGADQLGQWIDLWFACKEDRRARIRLLWSRKVHKLFLHPNKWILAKGPASATICTLLDAGWSPVKPDAWLAPNGKWAVLSSAAFAKVQIIGQFKDDLRKQAWSKAAGHHNFGKGLEEGGYIHGARSAKASLLKEENFAAAKALDLIVTGALGDTSETDPSLVETEHLCHRCNLGVIATRKHDYYECPDNDTIDNPFINKTNWLKIQVSKGASNPSHAYMQEVSSPTHGFPTARTSTTWTPRSGSVTTSSTS